MPLSVQNIGYQVANRAILQNISTAIEDNSFVAILGQNGAGKSTLVKLMAGELSPTKGQIMYEDKPLSTYTPLDLATRRAVLSQYLPIHFPIKAEAIISLGRTPYTETKIHKEAVLQEVMQITQTPAFTQQWYHQLSGGEKQRVHLARVLAQLWGKTHTPKYLFLDEPTAALDVKQQHFMLQTIKTFAQQFNVTVIAVLHDINLAVQYAQQLVLLKNGQIIAQGDLATTIDKNILEQVFDCEVFIQQHPTLPLPYLIF